MFSSMKEVAAMMEVSRASLRTEIIRNTTLLNRLFEMGWRPHYRFRKSHVLEIFKSLGFPDGYEHYDVKEIENQK